MLFIQVLILVYFKKSFQKPVHKIRKQNIQTADFESKNNNDLCAKMCDLMESGLSSTWYEDACLFTPNCAQTHTP